MIDVFPLGRTYIIEEEDILNGERGESCNCMLTLALKRYFPGVFISVGIGTVTIGDKTYMMDERMRVLRRKFDLGNEIWIGSPFGLEKEYVTRVR